MVYNSAAAWCPKDEINLGFVYSSIEVINILLRFEPYEGTITHNCLSIIFFHRHRRHHRFCCWNLIHQWVWVCTEHLSNIYISICSNNLHVYPFFFLFKSNWPFVSIQCSCTSAGTNTHTYTHSKKKLTQSKLTKCKLFRDRTESLCNGRVRACARTHTNQCSYISYVDNMINLHMW